MGALLSSIAGWLISWGPWLATAALITGEWFLFEIASGVMGWGVGLVGLIDTSGLPTIASVLAQQSTFALRLSDAAGVFDALGIYLAGISVGGIALFALKLLRG